MVPCSNDQKRVQCASVRRARAAEAHVRCSSRQKTPPTSRQRKHILPCGSSDNFRAVRHRSGVLLHSNAKPAKDHYRLESTGHPTLYPFKEKGQPPTCTRSFSIGFHTQVSQKTSLSSDHQPTPADVTISVLKH